MHQDFKDLLRCFNAHRVKYLVVGGYAVFFHSQPRATGDIDLLVKADPASAKAVLAALRAFRAPLAGITEEDLATPSKFLRFGRPPVAADVLTHIEAWTSSPLGS